MSSADDYNKVAIEWVHVAAEWLLSMPRNGGDPGLGDLRPSVLHKLSKVRVLGTTNERLVWNVYDHTNGEGTIGRIMSTMPTVWEGGADIEGMREDIAMMRDQLDRQATAPA